MPVATMAAPNALGTLNLKPAATAYKGTGKMAKRTALEVKLQGTQIMHRL